MSSRLLILLWLLAVPAAADEATVYREHLREILARREFRAVSREAAAPELARPELQMLEFPTWVWDQIAALYARLVEWLEHLLRRQDDRQVLRPGLAAVSEPLTLGLVLGAAALLGIVLWRLARRRHASSDATTLRAVAPSAEAMPDALARPADAWARFAEDFRGRGEWRLALRALYLQLLVLLHERGQIRYERQRTNGEYVLALRGEPAGEPFDQLTAIFDRAWYGNRPLGEAGYQSALVHARAIDAATSTPGAA